MNSDLAFSKTTTPEPHLSKAEKCNSGHKPSNNSLSRNDKSQLKQKATLTKARPSNSRLLNLQTASSFHNLKTTSNIK